MLPDVLGTYPGFLPGLLVAFAFSIWASEMVGRWLKVRRILAWLLVMGFGAVLAATLTPGRESLDFGFSPGGICDLRRMRPAMTALLSINYSSLNVLLLVPLGNPPVTPAGEVMQVRYGVHSLAICLVGLGHGGDGVLDFQDLACEKFTLFAFAGASQNMQLNRPDKLIKV